MSPLLLTFVLLFGRGANEKADTVSFPLGYYTFEEIAQKLSRPGRLVSCEADVRRRAALVSLHERSWDRASKLLCSALGLGLREQSGGGELVLSESEATKERDRKFRAMLEGFFKGIVDSDLQDLRQGIQKFGTLSDFDLSQRSSLLIAAGQEAKENPELKTAYDREWLQVCLLTDYRSQHGNGLGFFAYENGWIDLRFNAILSGRDWRAYPLSIFPENLVSRRASNASADGSSEYETCLVRAYIRRDSNSLSLCPQAVLVYPGGYQGSITQTRGMWGNTCFVDVVYHGTQLPVWFGFSKDVQKQYNQDGEASARILARPENQVPLNVGDNKSCVSDCVQSWAIYQNREVIYELNPPAESLGFFRLNPRISLKDVLSKSVALRLREEDGCLVFVNELAFIDHCLPFPCSMLVELSRNLKSVSAIGRFFDELADSHVASLDESMPLFHGSLLGVRVEKITSHAMPFLAWREFPQRVRTPELGKSLRLSLSSLSSESMDRLVKYGKRFEPDFQGWLGDYRRKLRNRDLLINNVSSKGEHLVNVRLVPPSVANPTDDEGYIFDPSG